MTHDTPRGYHKNMKYSHKKEIDGIFLDIIFRVKSELAKEGFGILTEIDVKATLKKKLDVDYDNYVILGACNPPFAHRALQAEKEIGLFLPCNVIVYENGGRIIVSATLPTVAMGIIENTSLAEIANEVEEKLIKVIDNV